MVNNPDKLLRRLVEVYDARNDEKEDVFHTRKQWDSAMSAQEYQAVLDRAREERAAYQRSQRAGDQK